MVKAGSAVDETITRLLPFLEKGDCIIDGGNSQYQDTARRVTFCKEKGLLFVGAGISGGEEGARRGPAIMPGGNELAWPLCKPILQSIAAVADDRRPCCEWIGPEGSGHFVKMVHNGIEYGDMQLIAEAYQILRDGFGMNAAAIGNVFAQWNTGELKSYLVEITAQIMKFKDRSGKPLVDKILDTVGQKGTGRWTVNAGLELGAPISLIAEAVLARLVAAGLTERTTAAKAFTGPVGKIAGAKKAFCKDLGKALYASKIVSYTQGFLLLARASEAYHWNLDLGAVARIWRNGCIIRSAFLDRISQAYQGKGDVPALFLAPSFKEALQKNQLCWRRVCAAAVKKGIAIPAMSAALAFFDNYRCARSGANLLSAQRDYFGAHQYERVGQPRGQFFHTNWTGQGGKAASSIYTE
jgi:6-phosphogluconate dehydrogenase